MAAPTIYRSTDASAPVLTGQVGALVNLLDKCLVAGYGAKAAAGWTKPYTGTNAAAFRPGAGPMHYLDVNDNASIATALAREAAVVGYETMSAIATGTQPFPAAAGAAAIRKSSTADATARVWFLIADDRTFYLFVYTADVANQAAGFGFGEIYSFLTGDLARTIILHRSQNTAVMTSDPLSTLANTGAALAGHVMPRGYTGLGSAVVMNKHASNVKSGATGISGVGIVPFPNPEDGGIYVEDYWLLDPTTSPTSNLRGRLRGLVNQYHAVASFATDDTFSGTGDLAGKSYIVLGRNGQNGVVVAETTAWDTST